MDDKTDKTYSTASLMKAFDLGRNTLRLYEEMGLLIDMVRTDSGYRKYTEKHLEDLRFILKAKDAGFTLSEIKNLLHVVRSQAKMTCGTVSQEISGKVEEIEDQMKMLELKKLFLNDFLKTCKSQSKESECNIIAVGFSKSACCN